MKCNIDFCSNLVASEELNNKRFSKIYCSFHVNNGVKVTCSYCNKVHFVRASRYYKSSTKIFMHNTCSISFRNQSDSMRLVSKNNIERFNNSEEGKKILVNNGLKYGLKNLKNLKIGICDSCSKHTELCHQSKGKRCLSCYNAKTLLVESKCSKCENIKRLSPQSNFKLCYSCYNAKIFDRELYYSKEIKDSKILFENTPLSFKDIDLYLKIPGVWAVFGYENNVKYCLDVCQTKNIGYEILGWIRQLNFCKGKTDEELLFMNKKFQTYNRIKKRNIASYENIEIVIVKTGVEDKILREHIESSYAHKFKSLFWSPAPGQKL